MFLTLLQRKFAREMGEDCPNNYYVHFREWVNVSYPQISEETWEHLIAEDLGIPYDDVMIDHEFEGSGYEGSHRDNQEQISISEYVDNVLDADQ